MNRNLGAKLRCCRCGALLAIQRDGGVEIRRRDVELVAGGRLSMKCYRCGHLNVFAPPHTDRPAAEVR